MLKDAKEMEIYALTVGGHSVGTFNLEISTTLPLNYTKYGKVQWQVPEGLAAYVHKLAILPAWQEQGLGTWCMQAIENLTAERGCSTVRLDAVKTHPKLLSFYENRGYQRVGELIYNSDVWVDSIVFEKVLREESC